jgi:hypothetical protein
MNVRRLMLDVDTARSGPSVVAIGEAISGVDAIEAFNITVTEIDLETVGMEVTLEGQGIDPAEATRAIEHAGAVVHSIDGLVAGDRVIESVARRR